MSLQAIKMIFEFLPRSYHNGAEDPVAREKMHNAATIAGVLRSAEPANCVYSHSFQKSSFKHTCWCEVTNTLAA
jgi:alcohol dehydrogenase class IV